MTNATGPLLDARHRWREAAARWAGRGEPYEQALELVSGEDASSAASGRDLLRTLGASATLAVVEHAPR